MVGAEFVERVKFFNTQWLPARDIILEAVKTRHEVWQQIQSSCTSTCSMPLSDIHRRLRVLS